MRRVNKLILITYDGAGQSDTGASAPQYGHWRHTRTHERQNARLDWHHQRAGRDEGDAEWRQKQDAQSFVRSRQG